MTKTIRFFLFILTIGTTCLMLAQHANAKVRYVTSTGAGTQDGSSWLNASRNLSLMLYISASGDEVWVAAGTYTSEMTPFDAFTADFRDRAFFIADGVKLYGGFAGTESSISKRDFSRNKSILSGDFNGDDVVTLVNGVPTFSGNTENAYHVVFVGSKGKTNKGIVLDGFTVTGGNANGNGTLVSTGKSYKQNEGGGIYATAITTTIRNCSIVRNTATAYAGGIVFHRCTNILDSSSVDFNGHAGIYADSSTNNFSSNSVSSNKGIGLSIRFNTTTLTGSTISKNSLTGIYADRCTNIIQNNTITENSLLTVSYDGGAGIDIRESTTTISGNTISKNVCGNGAGAIYIQYGTNIISKNFITENSLTNRGDAGGICIHAGNNKITQNFISKNKERGIRLENGRSRISDNIISENTSPDDGGGIFIAEIVDTLINNVFWKNTAGSLSTGGGIYLSANKFILLNNTLVGNKAGLWGGGLYTESGQGTISNTLLWGSKGFEYESQFDSKINTFKNCLFESDASRYTVASSGNKHLGTGAANNLFAVNPLFVDETDLDGADNILWTADDGLRLRPNSPALNAGDNTLLLPNVFTDLLSANRIQNGVVDMGAYEGAGVATSLEDELPIPNSPLFYPNPVTGEYITLRTTVSRYSLLNMEGTELMKGENADKIDIGSLAKGVYLLKIDTTVHKLVVQ